MQNRILTHSVLVLAIITGCTPLGEATLRKDGSGIPDQSATLAISNDLSHALATKRGAEPVQHPAEEPIRIPEGLSDPKARAFVELYGTTLKRYASRYGLDWRLVLATMKQESKFSPTAESPKGAQGLMQLMPGTADELADRITLSDPLHPEENIHGGVYYLKKLYDDFKGAEGLDRVKLTLAAYNAGIGRVYDAQDLVQYLNGNTLEWNAVRDALQLLSRRYSGLHQSVWQQEKPRSGWFGNSRETLEYVDKVVSNYEEFQLLFN